WRGLPAMLGQCDLIEVRVLDALRGAGARDTVAILEAIQDRALLRGLAELGAAHLQLGLVAVEVHRGLLAARAHTVHPRLGAEEVLAAAWRAGRPAGRVLRRAHCELRVAEHGLAAQALAEAGGERLR